MKRIAFIDSWLGVALLREFVFSCVFFNFTSVLLLLLWLVSSLVWLCFCCYIVEEMLSSPSRVYVRLSAAFRAAQKVFYWTHSFFWMNEITFKLERLCCQKMVFDTGHIILWKRFYFQRVTFCKISWRWLYSFCDYHCWKTNWILRKIFRSI